MTEPTTPAPVDPALVERVAEVIRGADSHSCSENEGADYPALTAAVLAELAPELARAEQAEADARWLRQLAQDQIDRVTEVALDRDEQRRRAERAETALTRVRELHQPRNVLAAAEHGEPADCTTCGPGTWTADGCPTTQALTGPAEENQP